MTVSGALDVTGSTWAYRPGRRCATGFTAFPDQLLRAFPRAPVIAVTCDNDSIHHARKVTAWLENHRSAPDQPAHFKRAAPKRKRLNQSF